VTGSFTASIKFTTETVGALSRAIYAAFGGKVRAAMLAGGALLIYLGCRLGLGTASGIVTAALGCWIAGAVNYPAAYKAKKVTEAFHGELPEIAYTFCDRHFTMAIGDRSQDYDYAAIIRLSEEKKYLYLFPDRNSAFMIDKSAVRPEDVEAFKAFLGRRVGLQWTRSSTLLSFNLPSAIRSWKNTRKSR
jgi:hypothetical protein